MPALGNLRLANYWPPEKNAAEGGFKAKTEQGEPTKGLSEEPSFPLVKFSGGIGGLRTVNSSACGDFASCGSSSARWSTARTFFNHPSEGIRLRRAMETNGHCDHWEREVKHRWDSLDFRFPKPNPYDTRPSNEQCVDREVRSTQIEMPFAMIAEACNISRAFIANEGSATAEQRHQKAQGLRLSYHGLITIE